MNNLQTFKAMKIGVPKINHRLSWTKPIYFKQKCILRVNFPNTSQLSVTIKKISIGNGYIYLNETIKFKLTRQIKWGSRAAFGSFYWIGLALHREGSWRSRSVLKKKNWVTDEIWEMDELRMKYGWRMNVGWSFAVRILSGLSVVGANCQWGGVKISTVSVNGMPPRGMYVHTPNYWWYITCSALVSYHVPVCLVSYLFSQSVIDFSLLFDWFKICWS